ncbi:Renal dipeptidase, partial [Neobacillus drentensis]
METKPNLDVTNFSNELKLLLGILRMDKDYIEQPLIEEMFKDIDWRLFIELVKHHRVYPIIYKKIKNIGKNAIPSNVQKTLYELYKQ